MRGVPGSPRVVLGAQEAKAARSLRVDPGSFRSNALHFDLPADERSERSGEGLRAEALEVQSMRSSLAYFEAETSKEFGRMREMFQAELSSAHDAQQVAPSLRVDGRPPNVRDPTLSTPSLRVDGGAASDPSPAALDALGIGFSELAAAIKEQAGSTKASQQTQVFPAEARGIASIDVQWDKLANGSCTERLRYARKIVGDIVSVCGSIMPATTEPEDEQAAVPENSRGVEIGLTWFESALEEAQLWARMMRTGNSHALAPLVRGSAAEAS